MASATDSPAPTRRSGPFPDERLLGRRATAADGIRIRADGWFSLAEVAYETGDGRATVESRRGRFVGYDFTLTNTGDERRPAVRDSRLRLGLAGGTYRHVHSLDGVSFSAVVDAPIEPLAWYEGLAPGESASLQLVFDVPHRPRFRHYLTWDHTTTVEGLDGPVYLRADGGSESGPTGPPTPGSRDG
jgi:hypothetical protein